MKLAALILACAASLSGQGISTIEIVAPSIRITAGDSMTLSAVALNGAGNPVPASIYWGVDNTTVASIDSAGKFSALTVGLALVTAGSGAVTHSILIQVTPDHVSISPSSANVMVGEKVQFTATAYDRNGKALTNVPFTWAIASIKDDYAPSQPVIGNVSASGMLTGAAEGSAYVRALYSYSQPPNASLGAGMELRIPIYAPFTVSAPRPYNLQRLFNAGQQLRQNARLTPRTSLLWATPDGRILFNAALDGVGSALLSYDGSSFQTVVAAGTPSNSLGSVISDVGRHAMAANGTLLTQQSGTDGSMIQSGSVDALQPLLVNNTAAGGVENLCCFSLSRNSVSSSGYFVFWGGFRIPGTNTFVNGLFRGAGNAVSDILFDSTTTFPEFGGGSLANSNDYGVDNNGVAWYVANYPGTSALYRHDSNGRQKFLAIGDPLLGAAVRYILQTRGGSATSSNFYAEDGTVFVSVSLTDGSNYLLRYTGTDPTKPDATLRVNSTPATLAYQPGVGVLIYANPYNNKGDGVWLWNGSTVTNVLTIGKTLVGGSVVQSVESGLLDANGVATLMLGTAANPMQIVRFANGNPQVLFKSGDTVSAPVPQMLNLFVPGARTGNPQFVAGGVNYASIAEWRDGAVQPLLVPADQPLGTTSFTGVNPYGFVQRTANGDLYSIIPGIGVGRYSGGKWSAALRFALKTEDGTTAWGPYRIAVNDTGSIAWISGTDKGDTRIYLSQGGRNQLVCVNDAAKDPASKLDGRSIFNCDDFVLDNAGRMMVRLRFQGDPLQYTYFWSQGQLTVAVTPNKTTAGNFAITGVNLLRATGNHLLAVLQTAAGSYLSEWTDSGWTVRYSPADAMPTGAVFNSVWSHMEASSSGDLAFVSSPNAPGYGVYAQRNGALQTVLTTYLPTPDGDYIVNILSLDLRDDGTVYLLAVNQNDELVFYSATPK